MEHEKKHTIKIPDNLLRQFLDSKQTDSPASPPGRRKRLKPQYRRRLIIRSAAFLLIPLTAAVITVWAITYKNAVEVYASDELIGLMRIDKMLTPESLAQETQNKLEEENQSQVVLTPVITLKPVHAGKAALSSKEELLNKLCGKVPFKVQASAFMLDGKPLVVLKDKTEALTVQDNIFAKYTSGAGNAVSVSFVENISIEDIFAEKQAIITMDKAIEALTAGTARSSVYTVKQGDALGKIAMQNNMALNDLIAANPGITARSTLRVGQELNIKTVKPLLSVKTVETVVRDEAAPAPVQQQINARAKTTRVIQAGQDGKQRVTEQVTRINGIVQGKTVLNTVTLEEPVPEIVEIPADSAS